MGKKPSMLWKLTVREQHTVDKTSPAWEGTIMFSRPVGQEQMFLILLNRAKLTSFPGLWGPTWVEKLFCSPPPKPQGSYILSDSETREKKHFSNWRTPSSHKNYCFCRSFHLEVTQSTLHTSSCHFAHNRNPATCLVRGGSCLSRLSGEKIL